MQRPDSDAAEVRLPHFSGGAVVVTGEHAEAFAEGARLGYPPVILV